MKRSQANRHLSRTAHDSLIVDLCFEADLENLNTVEKNKKQNCLGRKPFSLRHKGIHETTKRRTLNEFQMKTFKITNRLLNFIIVTQDLH